MGKMAMPDSACVGVTVEGSQTGRSRTYRGRIVDVDNPRDAKTLRELGAFDVNLGGATTRGGYVCSSCGFQAFFKACGRCGGVCERA